jgi:pyruvate formate lyase activating enzyme
LFSKKEMAEGGKDTIGTREAMFWSELGNGKVQCELCPHRCKLSEGRRGICGVRENIGGKLHTLIYGLGTSAHPDPIEKKPLYHFHPGSMVMSFGTVGCNFKCLHCQNYTISQEGPDDRRLARFSIEDVVSLTRRSNCSGVAWTYNEPTIWYEFTYDGSRAAKAEGLYSVYVSNGYINEEPLKKIAPYIDAMNIDVKAGNDDFYKKVCKGERQRVLETCERAHKLGILVELTYLVIPDLNDSEDEIRAFAEWAVQYLSSEVPIHFSRFHPDFMLTDKGRTPMGTMTMAYDIAKKAGAQYVYLGNVSHGTFENTYCPECGTLLLERFGFSADKVGLVGDECVKCGKEIPIRGLR